MIYPAGTCPPATEKDPQFAPSSLLRDSYFPNLHTFHIQWAGVVAQNGNGSASASEFRPTWDPSGYDSVRNFICDIDLTSTGNIVALYQDFKFPHLTTFTHKITLPHQCIESVCETLGRMMQLGMSMNWSSLESLKLEMHLKAGNVQDVSLCVCFPFLVACWV
jgi:hypothetical protein